MKQKRNQQGSALIVVLAVTAVLMLLSAAAIQLTLRSRQGNSEAKKELARDAAAIRLRP